MNLVVVESPAKAKTIKKYLGEGFEVLASYGHVRDLRPKEGAVEPDQAFAMHYEVIDRNEKHVAALTKAMKKADVLYLATDPDREGEAIAWHVAELLRDRNVLDDKPVRRVVFYEITKRAIEGAVENARDISMDLVNAQQACDENTIATAALDCAADLLFRQLSAVRQEAPTRLRLAPFVGDR